MQNHTDHALAALAGAGDREAFGALVERYGEMILAVVGKQLQDPHLAADVSQEIWVKVFRALPRWRPDGSFRSWLFSVALNQVRDCQRSQRRGKLVFLDDFRQHSTGAADDPKGRAEEHAAIEEALSCVTEPFQRALLMIDVLQLSYEEAAAALDCRVGTVKSRVNRGRLQFKDRYLRLSGEARRASSSGD